MTLDVLFEMRSHIQQGEPVHNCAHSVIQGSTYSCGEKMPLNEQELWYLERILYNGYFAFETLTRRDWNHSICGICGIAPTFESGDGNAKNCTALKKEQVCYDICAHSLSYASMLLLNACRYSGQNQHLKWLMWMHGGKRWMW